MENVYTKSEAVQMRGLAICAMVCVHLFCRKGEDVYGTPLLWTGKETPLVYWLGWISNICVPLYAICTGYAQQMFLENGAAGYFANLKRCWRLLLNFWMVLCLFFILSLFCGTRGDMPTNFREFLQQAFLIKFNNGAWWYLRSYLLIMLLLPPKVLLWPVRHIPWHWGMAMCLMASSIEYLIKRIGLFSTDDWNFLYFFIYKLRIPMLIPYIFTGAFACRDKVFQSISLFLRRRIPASFIRNLTVVAVVAISTLSFCLFEKSILLLPYTIIVFLCIPMIEKTIWVQQMFLFLGKHSTNIWLVHMFFYLILFRGLVIKLRFPMPMFVGLMFLSIISSFVIQGGMLALDKIVGYIKSKYLAFNFLRCGKREG